MLGIYGFIHLFYIRNLIFGSLGIMSSMVNKLVFSQLRGLVHAHNSGVRAYA